jgi:hypothetical protein
MTHPRGGEEVAAATPDTAAAPAPETTVTPAARHELDTVSGIPGGAWGNL